MKVSEVVLPVRFPTSFPISLERQFRVVTLSNLVFFCCKAALFEVCLRGDVGQLPNNPKGVLLLFLFCCPRSPSCSLPSAWLGLALPVPWVVGALLGSLPCAGPLLVKLTLGLRVHCSSTSFSCGEGRPVTMVAQATSW